MKLSDVKVIFKGKILNREFEIKNKFNHNYDNVWGSPHFQNIQLVIDDYIWFERTSYDGCEKYILKAHPLLSKFDNHESHPGS